MAKRYATIEEVRALYPQFIATDDALLTLIMECAEDCIGLDWYGEAASRAHLLMSAHMAWLHPSAGPTGTGGGQSQYGQGQAIASLTDGPASVSWHAPQTSEGQDAWLQTSPPGQMLAALDATRVPYAQLARDVCPPLPGGGGGYVL